MALGALWVLAVCRVPAAPQDALLSSTSDPAPLGLERPGRPPAGAGVERAGRRRTVRFGAPEWAAAGLPAAAREGVAAAAGRLAAGGAVSVLVEDGGPGDGPALVRCEPAAWAGKGVGVW